MPLSLTQLCHLLTAGNLYQLFIYLGWDNPQPQHPVKLPSGIPASSKPIQVAHKRGVGVWHIKGTLTAKQRIQLSRTLENHNVEHLIIFESDNLQHWRIKNPKSGGGLIGINYIPNDTDERKFAEFLSRLAFRIAEEGDLTVFDILDRLRYPFVSHPEVITERA